MITETETDFKTMIQIERIADALEIANRLKVIELKTRQLSVGSYKKLEEIEGQLYPKPQPRFSPDSDDGY